MDDHVNRRSHSFEPPYDPLQIATWVIYPLINLHFYAFYYFLLDFWDVSTSNPIQIVVLIVFTLSSLLSAWAAHQTCMTDPCDDALCGQQIQHPLEKIPASAEEQIFCYICECSVHHSSKHCRYCDKCVLKFDHHCKWLNTCVGQKNYKTFLALVCSVAVMLSVSEGLSVALLVNSYTHSGIMREVLARHALLGNLTLAGVRGVLIAGSFVYTAILAMVFQLLTFHMMLIYKGQTTYEFIIAEQKRQREKRNRQVITTTARQLTAKEHAPATAASASVKENTADAADAPVADTLNVDTVKVTATSGGVFQGGIDIDSAGLDAVHSTSDINVREESPHQQQASDIEMARAARFEKILVENSGDLVL